MPLWPFKRRRTGTIKDVAPSALSEKGQPPAAALPPPTRPPRPSKRENPFEDTATPDEKPAKTQWIESKGKHDPAEKENVELHRESREDITALPVTNRLEYSPHLRPVDSDRPQIPYNFRPHNESQSSFQRNDSIAQQSLPGTLRSKRSTTDYSTPRRGTSNKSKRHDHLREEEIRSMTAPIPIPIPKRPGDGPLRHDSKKPRGGAGTRESTVSLPPEGSIHSAMSGILEQRGWQLGALAVFNPRPNVRLSGIAPQYPSPVSPPPSAGVSSPRPKDKAPATRDSNRRRQVIGERADELDATDLRTVMERDAKRKERHQQRRQEKIDRKLASRAGRDRAESEAKHRESTEQREAAEEFKRSEAARARVEQELRARNRSPPTAIHPAFRDRAAEEDDDDDDDGDETALGLGIGEAIRDQRGEQDDQPEEEVPDTDPFQDPEPVPASEHAFEPEAEVEPTPELETGPEPDSEHESRQAISHQSLTTGNTSMKTPQESPDDSPMVTPMETPTMRPTELNLEDPVGSPLETPLEEPEPIVQTAQAVRMAHANTPPLSPVYSRGQGPTVVQATEVNTRPSAVAAVPPPPRIPPERRTSDPPRERRSGTWASFFRRGGTNIRKTPQEERLSTSEMSFSNTSRESMRNQPLPAHLVESPAQRSPTVLSRSSGLGRTQSRFREDLPELPISPPDSRTQSPDVTAAAAQAAASRRSKPRPQPIDISSDAAESEAATTVRSETPQSPGVRGHGLMSASLASIDSEGSWLASGSVKRQSTQSALSRSLSKRNASYEELGSGDGDAEYVRAGSGPHRRKPSASALVGASPDEESELGEDGEAEAAVIAAATTVSTDPLRVHGSARRKPTLVHRDPRVRSREGLLTEYAGGTGGTTTTSAGESPTRSSEDNSPESDVDLDIVNPQLQNARSVDYGSRHSRQFSAGSAKLLDLSGPRRPSIDANIRNSLTSTTVVPDDSQQETK